ncbi:DNA alkylation repair protein [Oceanobacillus polygoni]|uniref:3-methyladenine DNA glycosylase AlkC n=1 Tax=Oceanobacillus polygoni TaxID=1235259 RepID=A0A9X1CKI9_9BACI|nr:DNA alkylation repair protein [Oceanobacillus polygoni]MBP2079422.1 3-methyladenine DNA glycosylase AlkC [Oceanobacillus polygoni]
MSGKKTNEKGALKYYFGTDLALHLSSLIQPHYKNFPVNNFVKLVQEQVEPLELKDRVAVISEALFVALPSDYPKALDILLKIVGPENETEERMFTNGYFLMPVAYFVERFGINHFENSMHALYEITKRHTSEYAIRPYLERYPDESLNYLHNWLHDNNPHVRRLVSEGTRPRLPWAKRIKVMKDDPAINLALLDSLLTDPSFYVRKSVANHLNDLSKEHRNITLNWMSDQLDRKKNDINWIIRHGLRSLAKSGDPKALALLERI